ncbi:MAG: cAMP-binding protein [Bacteroidetes bacterium]|nr:cAMP-binding protein [Bacteroidota bacterium]
MSAGVEAPKGAQEKGGFPPALLAFLPAFYGLTPDETREIATIIVKVAYRQGQVVFDESSPGDALYVILRGRVDIRVGVGDEARTIASLPEGSILGELALLDQQTRSASAVASEETVLLRLETDEVHDLMSRGSVAAYKVIYNLGRVVAQRLRAVNKQLVNALSDSNQKGSEEEITELEKKLLTEWNF